MSGEERREQLLARLKTNQAISGTDLAKLFGVSRQVIVQDIALLRTSGSRILSTNKGYVLEEDARPTRVFKLYHTPETCMDELNLIVDYGGHIEDIFIYHKVYNVVRAPMNVRSRKDVAQFMEQIRTGKSSLLSVATSGYHYHTISADTEQELNDIYEQLEKHGFLAKLQDYEPVDFWKKEDMESGEEGNSESESKGNNDRT